MAWKYPTLLLVEFLSICSIYSICSIDCLKHSPMLGSESLVRTFPSWQPVHQQSSVWWQPSQPQSRPGVVLLLIDPHFHDLWISILYLQVIPGGTEPRRSPCYCCGCIVCCIIMGKHLSTAWIKRKDRHIMFYEEWEQNTHTQKKDVEQLDHTQKEISKRS